MEFLETSWIFNFKPRKYKYWVQLVYPGSHVIYKTIQVDSCDEIWKSCHPLTCITDVRKCPKYPDEPFVMELQKLTPVLYFQQLHGRRITNRYYNMSFLPNNFSWTELQQLFRDLKPRLQKGVIVRLDFLSTFFMQGLYTDLIDELPEFGLWIQTQFGRDKEIYDEYPNIQKFIFNK
jgi:hypothetical protein